MLKVDENYNIFITRGDTGIFQIELTDADGQPYTPQEGDSLRFAMAKNYNGEHLVIKDIPIDTLLLKLDPEDTKQQKFGSYVYDIQFTDSHGDVFTIILSKIILMKEVA